jgi:hypothetical protein
MKQVFLLAALLLAFEAQATYKPQPQQPALTPIKIGIDIEGNQSFKGSQTLNNKTIANAQQSQSSENNNKSASSVDVQASNPWPSSFLSGYAGASMYNCSNAFGASGGYGSLLIPWESSDCKRFHAAQMFFARGSIKAACRMLMTIDVIEDATNFEECMEDYTTQSKRQNDVKTSTAIETRPEIYYELKRKYTNIK